ncbi:MAG: YabP/YqfC family sporulation protein [Clostridia bacterium]
MNKIEQKMIDISRKLEVPTNLIRDVSKIEVISNDTVIIENHKGILNLDDTEIHINCGDLIVKIFGFNLVLGAISQTDILIVGNITNIDFLR